MRNIIWVHNGGIGARVAERAETGFPPGDHPNTDYTPSSGADITTDGLGNDIDCAIQVGVTTWTIREARFSCRLDE